MRQPIHIVRYFKGEEVRTLSKHLQPQPAQQVAKRFMQNLLEKRTTDQSAPPRILTHQEPRLTILHFVSATGDVEDEGVAIQLSDHPDPSWDYPQYSPVESQSSSTDSGHVTTAERQQTWPFTLIPR